MIARCVSGGQKTPLFLPQPFRLLLFVSSPEDLDPERSRLDFEGEEELLYTALDRWLAKGQVQIDVAEDGCLSTLLGRLEQTQYHAVILSMHGVETRNVRGEREWGLLLEDEQTGRKLPVAGSDLAGQLEELPRGRRPGLVVLSACRSARLQESGDSISSVARTLYRSGLERVIGMRLSVMDHAMSAFNAKFFSGLLTGQSLGRAVSLARRELASGKWLDESAQGDPFAQWTLPVLLDRTSDGPLLDLSQSVAVPRSPPLGEVLAGDGSLQVPDRAAFVGRRAEIRRDLRGFLGGDTPRLLFTGPGGVGKTTLAGLFVRRLRERTPQVRVLGFRAPFDLSILYEPLRREAFDGQESATLLQQIQVEPEARQRIYHLLHSLATRQQRPFALLLDNLEVLQELSSLQVRDADGDSLWFVQTVCSLRVPTRVLVTGRYAIQELGPYRVQRCAIGDAPYGDVLSRMNRLAWPAQWDIQQKRQLYQTLGGNHRALEWLAQLLAGRAATQARELIQALEALQAPPGTPQEAVAVVLDAMRQNLLFEQLLAALTAGQQQLLRTARGYRIAVTEDGLLAVDLRPERAEANRQGLVDHSLLQAAEDRSLELTFYEMPPVVRELLAAQAEAAPRPELHARMARYHAFQGQYVTRRWSDDIEAVYHYRAAGEQAAADRLAEGVADFYYRISDFSAARALTEEIVARSDPPPPWWALNRYGQCQLVLGQGSPALEALQRALQCVPDRRSEGTTLNDISQIYKARGDYDTALQYLEQSLQIRREIGDKAGEGVTLNNISGIYDARGDYDTALQYLEQSLQIQREIGDKRGEGVTLNNISQIYDARGDNDAALQYLEQSLQIQREIGDKAGMIPTLHNMAHIALQDQKGEAAITYWSEALQLAQETQNAQGTFHVAGALGSVLAEAGDTKNAIALLERAVQIGRAAGFDGVQDLENTLQILASKTEQDPTQ